VVVVVRMSAASRRLIEAVADGDDRAASSAAGRTGVDLNVVSESGEPALIIAAKAGRSCIAEDLARRGANLEACDRRFGWTAIMFAASRGHLQIVACLIGHRADVGATGRDGESALMLASLLGHTAVCELVLELGSAEVDRVANDGKRSLTHACYKGYWATALCLVAHGACLNTTDRGGRGPLAWAALQGHAEIVRFLAERMADIEACDQLRWSPLMLAAKGGHIAIVMCLAERHADLEARGADGETTLMLAALNGHAHVVEFLATRGVELDTAAEDGMTALKLAAEAGHFEAAQRLAEYGAELPEDGLRVAPGPWMLMVEHGAQPGLGLCRDAPGGPSALCGLTLTPGLARQLVVDIEVSASSIAEEGGDATLVLARVGAAASRWGFAPTELGYRRMLRVVEAAGVEVSPLKAALYCSDALMVDAERDGLFDWDDIGGIEDLE